jgi:TrmH family RNA methyltransferase
MNIPKLVRELSRRKGREERGMVVAEGHRLVTDVLRSGAKIEALLAADDAAQDSLFDSARALKAELAVVPRREFDELADTETPSGVLAVVRWEPASLSSIPGEAIALVIDGVQDPGNVGTMIRTAHALGARCTIALDGTADVRSQKVVRSAMGALFRHPVVQATWADLRDALTSMPVCLAVQDGVPAREAARTLPKGAALVIGSEGHGVRAEWQSWTGPVSRVGIPMRQGAESLNAAIAAGILLYELARES